MASGTIQVAERPAYITPKITYALPDGIGLMTAIYDPIGRTVVGNFYVRGATAFNQSKDMFQIPEAYRPYTNYGASMLVKTSSGDILFGLGTIRSDGGVRQTLAQTAVDVYCSFFYQTAANNA